MMDHPKTQKKAHTLIDVPEILNKANGDLRRLRARIDVLHNFLCGPQPTSDSEKVASPEPVGITNRLLAETADLARGIKLATTAVDYLLEKVGHMGIVAMSTAGTIDKGTKDDPGDGHYE